MTLDWKVASSEGPEGFPDFIRNIMDAQSLRVSETINYTSLPQPGTFRTNMSLLKQVAPDIYERIIRGKGVIELGGGESVPEAKDFEKHPLEYYVSIDLNHRDRQYRAGKTLVIEKLGDFYSVLEAIADGCLSCIYMQALDTIIIRDPKERKRLRELIKKKLAKDGVVITSASEIYPGTQWSRCYYLQPNLEDESMIHEIITESFKRMVGY